MPAESSVPKDALTLLGCELEGAASEESLRAEAVPGEGQAGSFRRPAGVTGMNRVVILESETGLLFESKNLTRFKRLSPSHQSYRTGQATRRRECNLMCLRRPSLPKPDPL